MSDSKDSFAIQVVDIEPEKAEDVRFKALIEASPDPVVIYDSLGNVTYLNPAFETVYGFSKDEIMGKKVDFVPEDEKEKTQNAWAQTINGEKLIFETRRKTKSGGLLHIQMSTAIIRDKNNKHFESIVIHRNITPIKAAEKEREQLIENLKNALAKVETLSGLVPICSNCKKIRDDKGYWNNIEKYIEQHSKALFSHGICPDCQEELYGDQDWFIKKKNQKNK